MCGIVAYVGEKPCRQYIFDGLARLEYRGYDSAGFVCIDARHNHFSYHKEAGGVDLVKKLAEIVTFDGNIGLGHTRWATHGVVDQRNAHPHFNCRKSVAVVHNGIIEGFEALRERLIQEGHDFYSSTDTEIAAHLFSSFLTTNKNIKSALLGLTKKLRGAYALAFLLEDYPDQLVIVRHKSPMVVGVGKNEMFVASDFLAFSDKTNQVIFLPDDSCAIIRKNNIELFDFVGNSLSILPEAINITYATVDKQGFEHFMLKEIYEQKRAIMRTINFFDMIGCSNENLTEKTLDPIQTLQSPLEYNECIWRQLGITRTQVKDLKSFNLVAAGTSWHAARIGQFFFEIIAKIPTHVYLASEFRYMPLFVNEKTLYLMISQSGETADTLEALRLVNSFDMQTIALTNVASSSMVREASGFLPMQAGPEISVAATKTFSSQMSSLYWLAHRMAYERGEVTAEQLHNAEENLYVAAEILETTIETYKLKIIQEIAPKYSKFDRYIFLGRHVSYPFALEAALKLKEITYIFAQCYPAGELKHGPIALIDEYTPVIIFSVLDELIYNKLVSNANEIKARKGKLMVFAFDGQRELINIADVAFVIPKVTPLLVPLVMTGIMQFFVYQIARELNRPPDRPRNLAKSVTVE
jgi:glucosamine--fructose-6-phosphate aminotransferase (isomerizing)